MNLMKTATAAAFVAVATLASGVSTAEAGKKKPWSHHHHHHHKSKKFHGPKIVIATPGYGCGHWYRLYKKTGKKKFLGRYYACMY